MTSLSCRQTQCGGEYTELGPRADLLSLDLSVPPFSGEQLQGSADLLTPAGAAAHLHAVVVWADYDLLGEAGQEWLQGGVSAPQVNPGSSPQAALGLGSTAANERHRIDNGPSNSAYSATQTVLLLIQPQTGGRRALPQGVRVSARLEEQGMSLSAHFI